MKFKKIFSSQKSYIKWRLEKIKRIEKRFPEIFRVENKKILDIGCGDYASLSCYLSGFKNAQVYAGDINPSSVANAKKITKRVNFSVFPAEALPFKDNFFDFVFILDVLEHVNNPLLALKEAKRVVKKNGFIFIEFSPYYAYPTGHHLYPLGFPLGLLPFQFIPINLTEKIVVNAKFDIKNLGNYLFKQFKSLNKITIKKFKLISKKVGLKLIKEEYLLVLPNKEININFIAHFPILKELMTFGYSGFFTKNPS